MIKIDRQTKFNKQIFEKFTFILLKKVIAILRLILFLQYYATNIDHVYSTLIFKISQRAVIDLTVFFQQSFKIEKI